MRLIIQIIISTTMLLSSMVVSSAAQSLKSEIINHDERLKVISSSIVEEANSSYLYGIIQRKKYVWYPTGSHLHITVQNKQDEVIQELLHKIQRSDFRKKRHGTWLSSRFNYRLPIKFENIKTVNIEVFTISHDQHVS